MKETIDLNSNSRKSKFVAKENRVQESKTIPSKIKTKREGSNFFKKFGKIVAATTHRYGHESHNRTKLITNNFHEL